MYYKGISDQKFREIMAIVYEYKCQYCLNTFDFDNLHVDHIYPKNLGGKNDLLNYTLSCERCNQKKSNYVLTPAANGFLQMLADRQSRKILSKINSFQKISRKEGLGIAINSHNSTRISTNTQTSRKLPEISPQFFYGGFKFYSPYYQEEEWFLSEDTINVYKKLLLNEKFLCDLNDGKLTFSSNSSDVLKKLLDWLSLDITQMMHHLRQMLLTFIKVPNSSDERLCLSFGSVATHELPQSFSKGLKTIKLEDFDSFNFSLNYLPKLII